MKFSTVDKNQAILCYDDDVSNVVRIGYNSGAIRTVHWAGDGETGDIRYANVDKNKWYHVYQTYDGNKLYLYVNGLQVGSKSISNLQKSVDYVSMGAFDVNENDPTLFLDGFVSDARIYKRTLTPQEISYLYEQKF